MEKRRQQRKNRRDIGSGIMYCTVILLMLALAFSGWQLLEKRSECLEEEAELRTLIREEELRGEEIDAYEVYVTTDEYVEQIARERLGFAYPNEILFRPEE